MNEFRSRLRLSALVALLVAAAVVSMVVDRRALIEGTHELSRWSGGILDIAVPIQKMIAVPADIARDAWTGPHKSWRWLRRRYFRSEPGRQWIFTANARNAEGAGKDVDLFQASSLRIRRHIKMRGEATVFDPEHASYFRERQQRKGSLARNRSVVQPAF